MALSRKAIYLFVLAAVAALMGTFETMNLDLPMWADYAITIVEFAFASFMGMKFVRPKVPEEDPAI